MTVYGPLAICGSAFDNLFGGLRIRTGSGPLVIPRSAFDNLFEDYTYELGLDPQPPAVVPPPFFLGSMVSNLLKTLS